MCPNSPGNANARVCCRHFFDLPGLFGRVPRWPTNASPLSSAMALIKTRRMLPNPPADAKALAALLRGVGFDVIEGTDLTRDAMTERLLDFGKKSAGRRHRGLLLCRARPRAQRHQLSAAGRTPISNRIWTSSLAPQSTSICCSSRPWTMPRPGWCSSTPAATTPFVARIKSKFGNPERISGAGSCRNEV